MGLQNNFWEFDFLKEKFFIDMKELVEKGTGFQGLKTYLSIFKKSWRSKNGPKIAKLFPWSLTSCFELIFQN